MHLSVLPRLQTPRGRRADRRDREVLGMNRIASGAGPASCATVFACHRFRVPLVSRATGGLPASAPLKQATRFTHHHEALRLQSLGYPRRTNLKRKRGLSPRAAQVSKPVPFPPPNHTPSASAHPESEPACVTPVRCAVVAADGPPRPSKILLNSSAFYLDQDSLIC